jgi:hypothetical protein
MGLIAVPVLDGRGWLDLVSFPGVGCVEVT